MKTALITEGLNADRFRSFSDSFLAFSPPETHLIDEANEFGQAVYHHLNGQNILQHRKSFTNQ